MRWFSIAALLLSVACGSRSGLSDSRLGAGGDSGTGGGNSGGNGGSTACSTFVAATPTLQVPNLGEQDSAPAFVDPPNDPENVTLVFVRRPNPGSGQPSLAHVDFPAWNAWPPTLGSVFASLTTPSLKNDHRVAPSLDGKFAAAAVLSDVVHFAPQLDVNSPDTGDTLPLLGTKPLFLSELDDEAFVIGTLSIQRELYVQIADPTLQDPVPIATIACADDDLVGGAVPFANGWLLAHSNGANAPAAVCEPPATANAGSATRIDIVKLEKSSITKLLTNIEASGWVSELVVAAHPDGISFAWIDGRLHWARYVGKTGAIVGPVVVAEAADAPSSLAMTAFGARSLVTYTRSSGKSARVTKLLDASGTERASVTLAMELVGRAAIIADPAEHAALLAYESMSPGVIEVTRLECAP